MHNPSVRLVFAGWMVFLLLAEIFGVMMLNVPLVKAGGAIFIRSDGSVDPQTAPISSVDNVTYIFTSDIFDSIVVERSNITIDGNGYKLQGSGSGNGFYWSGARWDGNTKNVTIKNTNIMNFTWGVRYFSSANNTISGNKITANMDGGGILVDNCYFYGYTGGRIIGNSIVGNKEGILLNQSGCIVVAGNSITSNSWGIRLNSFSYNNIISGNTIANNTYGVLFIESETPSWYNEFYHNNFIDNTKQVDVRDTSVNSWNDDYPSGGNYWSDYIGIDLYSGPFQNETGSDGIGDTPYFISEVQEGDQVHRNGDNYPLMNPWIGHELVAYLEAPAWLPPGRSSGLNATVTNKGKSNESNVELLLLINGSVVSSTVIPLLQIQSSHTISYPWTPTAQGMYNVTAYATPVLEEVNRKENNRVARFVKVMRDVSPPTTLCYYNDVWHTFDFDISLAATDDASGVAETCYRINDGPVKIVRANGQPVITKEGADNTLEYWSLDMAGFEELPHKMLSGIKLDKTLPIASAGQDQTVNVGLTTNFDASGSTDNLGIISYKWNFGDGTTQTGKTANHIYTSLGTYTVTLTVTDVAGNTNTRSITITVVAAEAFPTMIVGATIATIAIVVAAATFLFLRKRK